LLRIPHEQSVPHDAGLPVLFFRAQQLLYGVLYFKVTVPKVKVIPRLLVRVQADRPTGTLGHFFAIQEGRQVGGEGVVIRLKCDAVSPLLSPGTHPDNDTTQRCNCDCVASRYLLATASPVSTNRPSARQKEKARLVGK
jgi:hypothetical protein